MKEHLFNALSEYLEEDESVGGYKYKNTKFILIVNVFKNSFFINE